MERYGELTAEQIKDVLGYGTWSVGEACSYLACLDPDNSELEGEFAPVLSALKLLVELSDTPEAIRREATKTLAALNLRGSISARILLAEQRDFDIFEAMEMRDNLQNRWHRQGKPERAPPADFIKWAKSDGFTIPWNALIPNDKKPQGNSESPPNVLAILGAVLEYALGKNPKRIEEATPTQSSISQAIAAYRDGERGFSQRTCDAIFSKANKALKALDDAK